MKKLLLICVCAALACTVKAQNFGLQAGATFYSYKIKTDNESFTADTKVGFTIGVTSSWAMGTNFSFMPALNFTQKGGTLKDPDGLSDEKLKDTYNYLELPLNFVYNSSGASGSFFIGVGPALGWGLGGKSKSTTNSSENFDIHFGNDNNDDYKAFELSANALAGYKCNNGFFVSANYNLGLSDINPDAAGDEKFHNNGFALRIGYMFGGKMKKKASNDNK